MAAIPGPSADTSAWPGLAGVILAGGASRRMGRDKATLTVSGAFEGRTLIEQLLTVVQRRCHPIFVVAAPGQRLPELSAQVLRDEVPGLGPLPATGRGLRAAAKAQAQRAFVCAVDMPFLTVELIDALAAPAARLGADAVLPWDGRDHYLAGVYRSRLGERIAELVAAGERRMGALVGLVDAQRIVLTDSQPLANLNSAEDLWATTRR